MLRVNSRRTKNRKGCATNGGAGSLLLPLLLILCASGNLLEMVAGKVGSSRARYAYNNKSVVDGNNADTAKDPDTDPDTEANNNTNLHLLEEDIDPVSSSYSSSSSSFINFFFFFWLSEDFNVFSSE